jgi:hypothetical protein
MRNGATFLRVTLEALERGVLVGDDVVRRGDLEYVVVVCLGSFPTGNGDDVTN